MLTKSYQNRKWKIVKSEMFKFIFTTAAPRFFTTLGLLHFNNDNNNNKNTFCNNFALQALRDEEKKIKKINFKCHCITSNKTFVCDILKSLLVSLALDVHLSHWVCLLRREERHKMWISTSINNKNSLKTNASPVLCYGKIENVSRRTKPFLIVSDFYLRKYA